MNAALNQDNVLGEDELSQSGFSDRHESQDEDKPAKKKINGAVLAAGGAGMLLFVAVMGWKIVGPYFQHGGAGASSMMVDAPAPSPAPEPAQMNPAGAAPRADAAGQGQYQPAPMPAPLTVQPPPMPAPLQPMPEPSPAPPVPAAATAPQNQLPLMQLAAEIDSIKARMDKMEQSIAALGAHLDKKNAQPAAARSEHTKAAAPAAAKPREKSSNSRAATASAQRGRSEEGKEGGARGDVQLKAVLDGRAWFQTRSGESITAAPGDEVRGMGVVDKIDAENGKVVFTNGAVAR